jgi:CpeT protein
MRGSMTNTRALLLLCFGLSACIAASIDTSSDAGTLDAGTLDAGTLDAGTLDAGALDAGALDAGALDAGILVEDRLAVWLAGTYDTADQSLVDPNFLNIHLSLCRVSAPELGPRVLYVEQAVAGSLSAPYRQRLYVVEPVSDAGLQATSRVFELVNPRAAVGACQRLPVVFTAAQADERAGCLVRLDWQPDAGSFVGGTIGSTCLSSLRGASYATTEVTLTAERLTSLDRGWTDAGVQVWGSTLGPYEFVRRSPLPTP